MLLQARPFFRLEGARTLRLLDVLANAGWLQTAPPPTPESPPGGPACCLMSPRGGTASITPPLLDHDAAVVSGWLADASGLQRVLPTESESHLLLCDCCHAALVADESSRIFACVYGCKRQSAVG